MKEKEYTGADIIMLEDQLAVKKVINKYDLIQVSDVDFAAIQEILVRNDIAYTSIRDAELKSNTLLII